MATTRDEFGQLHNLLSKRGYAALEEYLELWSPAAISAFCVERGINDHSPRGVADYVESITLLAEAVDNA